MGCRPWVRLISVVCGVQALGAFDIGTGDALSLGGLGDDGEGLVAGLVQRLTQLLHAVAVHHHRLPPAEQHSVSLTHSDPRRTDPQTPSSTLTHKHQKSAPIDSKLSHKATHS